MVAPLGFSRQGIPRGGLPLHSTPGFLGGLPFRCHPGLTLLSSQDWASQGHLGQGCFICTAYLITAIPDLLLVLSVLNACSTGKEAHAHRCPHAKPTNNTMSFSYLQHSTGREGYRWGKFHLCKAPEPTLGLVQQLPSLPLPIITCTSCSVCWCSSSRMGRVCSGRQCSRIL